MNKQPQPLAPFSGKRILLGTHAEPLEIKVAAAIVDGQVSVCIGPVVAADRRKIEKSFEYLANQLFIELLMRSPRCAASSIRWLWQPVQEDPTVLLPVALRWTGFRYHPAQPAETP